MRVALDATPLTLAVGGLRRYVAELSAALAAEYPEDRYVLASDQRFAMRGAAPPNLTRAEAPRNRLERRWWSCGLARLARRERIDVFHGTNFEVPVAPIAPSVLTLHDLSPWREAAWHSGADRVRERTPWLLGLGLATMVITPTRAVRGEAMERFRIPPHRIVAVPEAASLSFRPVEAESAAAAPYFLYAGALEPRKNLAVIVEAWRQLRSRHRVDLILAGPRREGFDAPVPEPGLRIAGVVPDEELARLHSGALAFLYPSLYEGFGLPVLEAMQCGAPVFVSRDPALAEVAGGAAVALETRDTGEWAAAMLHAVEDPGWRTLLCERSLARSREFSWKRSAQLTREVYAEAILRFGV